VIPRIFAIGVTDCIKTKSKDRFFKRFENFMANQESSPRDEEAVSLLQSVIDTEFSECKFPFFSISTHSN
jgi:hypothetical protein